MRRYLTELGNQGIILRMRIKELFRDMEQLEESILRDYSDKAANVKKILSGISFEGIIDMESLSRLLFEISPDTPNMPKGYRILSKLNLTDREIKALILEFNNLNEILAASDEGLYNTLKSKTPSFRKELDNLKEQILVGKKI